MAARIRHRSRETGTWWVVGPAKAGALARYQPTEQFWHFQVIEVRRSVTILAEASAAREDLAKGSGQ
jgi:hypothetical protein